jgi:hypothetical protein
MRVQIASIPVKKEHAAKNSPMMMKGNMNRDIKK